jgi:transcriptional regulator with GAF, ATPase, and Fis domain
MEKKINSSLLGIDEYPYLLSLFQEEFSLDWVVELTGEKPSHILSFLQEGVKQGWLSSNEPGTYSFKDLKKRKDWGAKFSCEEREQMHGRISEFFVKELPDGEEKAFRVAFHLLHIINDEEGCRWLINAGDLCRKAFRVEESLKYYTKALDDLYGLIGEQADDLYAEAAIKYSKVSTARHKSAKVLSILNEAMVRAKNQSNQTHELLLEMHIAKTEWLRSQYNSALTHFEQGWSIAKKLDQPGQLRSANTFVTFFLYWQGRFREAIYHYEKFLPEVDRFPQGGFPILAAIMVGHCYAQIGQVTQGLGMVDAIRTECFQRGIVNMAAEAEGIMGSIMLDIGHPDDALHYLECSVKEGGQEHNDWSVIWGNLQLASAYFLKKDKKRTIHYLHEFVESSRKVEISVRLFPYLFEILWAIEQGELPSVHGLSLEKEILQSLEGKNIFLKGFAHRYQALLQREKGLPHEEIIQSLNLSMELFEECGHQIELAKTRLEIARQYLSMGDEEKGKKNARKAFKILSPINDALIPDDLRFLIKDRSQDQSFMREILKLGQEVVTIRDTKDLVQHIISAVNRITGAERGAIFLWEGNKIQLRASKNITSDQIISPSFSCSMKMIEEVVTTRRGRISGTISPGDQGALLPEIIRSRICVPMILKGRVMGVLYHDNRLISSTFKESDLELLSYFAAQAAIALDNSRAYEEIQRLNQKLEEEKHYYEEQHLQTLHFGDIIGESPAIMQVLEKIDQVARAQTNVLILGETGVGKELIARAIHHHSPRSEKPFIRVFCSALPDSLIPSELFGHEKGAFTGATHRRVGRFELADEGTLFLDEIGDLPLEIQVRLLRVLQSKEFERVGGAETLRSDFRLVAATNRNLEQAVKDGRFRSDLYYRLNVFPIWVPPLRERKEDIPLLAHYFFKIYVTKLGKTFDGIPKSEMDKLIQYDWPGNVRELENIIERGTILNSGPYFRVPDLGVGLPELAHPKANPTLEENERRHILWALQKTGWKVRGFGGAAELLAIHPSTLAFRMKKLGIQRPVKLSGV